MTLIVVGPLAGTYVAAVQSLPEKQRPNLWAVSELPLSKNPLPDALLKQITFGPGLCVAEEHVARGGFGSELALHIAEKGIGIASFHHLCARKHIYDTYGSQTYLRQLSGLDAEQMLACVTSGSPIGDS